MAINPPEIEPTEACTPHSTSNNRILLQSNPKREPTNSHYEERHPVPARIPYSIYRPYLDVYSNMDLQAQRSSSIKPTNIGSPIDLKHIESARVHTDSDYSSLEEDKEERGFKKQLLTKFIKRKSQCKQEKSKIKKHKANETSIIEQSQRKPARKSPTSNKWRNIPSSAAVVNRKHTAEKMRDDELLHQDEEFARHLQHLEYMAARPGRRQMAELANTRLVEQFCSSPMKSPGGRGHEDEGLTNDSNKRYLPEQDENKPKMDEKVENVKPKISESEKHSKKIKKETKRVFRIADSDSSASEEKKSKVSSPSKSKSQKKSHYSELEKKYRKQNLSFQMPYKLNAQYRKFFRNPNGKMCVNEICEAFYHYICKKDLVFKHKDGQPYIRFDDKLCDLFEHSHTPCEFKMTEVGRILITIHLEFQKGHLLAPLSDLLPSTSAQYSKST